MNMRFTCYCITLICVWPSALLAQSKPQDTHSLLPPSATLSDDEKQFDRVVATFESTLKDCQRFTVNVTSQWKSSGTGADASGTNLFRVVSQIGGKLLIEAGSKETGAAQFVCASDGRRVTWLHRPAKLYAQQPVKNLYQQLQRDQMTVKTLSLSGIEFLIHPDFRAQLVAQILSLKDMGTETVDGQKVHRFQLKMNDHRQIDVSFAERGRPLLVRMKTTVTIPIEGEKSFQLATTTRFQWDIGGALPDATFAVTLPADARKVSSLLAALQHGDISRLLDKPAPDFQLTDLSGQQVRLADHRGKNIVVLIFWASWCAPSTRDMGTLNQFVAECKQNGIAVYAINLGEDKQKVEQSVKQHQYQGTVLLDPTTITLGAFQLSSLSLPVTILIDKSGVVKTYFSGSGPEIRAQVRQAVAALAAGKPLPGSK